MIQLFFLGINDDGDGTKRNFRLKKTKLKILFLWTLKKTEYSYFSVQWTLPIAYEILIGKKTDPFCFQAFPGNDSVRCDRMSSLLIHPRILVLLNSGSTYFKFTCVPQVGELCYRKQTGPKYYDMLDSKALRSYKQSTQNNFEVHPNHLQRPYSQSQSPQSMIRSFIKEDIFVMIFTSSRSSDHDK
jgi:hypothetical protein